MSKRHTILILLLAVTLSGCSWEPLEADTTAPVVITSPPTTGGKPAAATQAIRRGDAAAAIAERMIGTPYRWGGADLTGFDCSGLVYFSFAQAALQVPRTTQQQRRFSQAVTRDALRRGDLVFFDIEGKTNHVGVYLGDERFVHAPSRGKRVQTASMTQPYFARRFAGAGRVPGADIPVD